MGAVRLPKILVLTIDDSLSAQAQAAREEAAAARQDCERESQRSMEAVQSSGAKVAALRQDVDAISAALRAAHGKHAALEDANSTGARRIGELEQALQSEQSRREQAQRGAEEWRSKFHDGEAERGAEHTIQAGDELARLHVALRESQARCQTAEERLAAAGAAAADGKAQAQAAEARCAATEAEVARLRTREAHASAQHGSTRREEASRAAESVARYGERLTALRSDVETIAARLRGPSFTHETV